jgi:hypothetical protein
MNGLIWHGSKNNRAGYAARKAQAMLTTSNSISSIYASRYVKIATKGHSMGFTGSAGYGKQQRQPN